MVFWNPQSRSPTMSNGLAGQPLRANRRAKLNSQFEAEG